MRWQPTVGLRVAAIVAAALAISMAALAVTAYELESSGSRDRFVQASVRSARADFAQAAQAAAAAPPGHEAQAIRTYVEQRGVSWRISVPPPLNSPHGRALLGSISQDGCIDDRFPDRIDDMVVPGVLRHAWVRLCSLHHTVAVYGAPVAGISLAEFFDFNPVLAQLAHLRRVLLWLTAGGLVVAVLVGLLVGRLVARPVRRVTTTARRLGDDLSVRLPEGDLGGGREFAELGHAFNDMATRLDGARQQQRRFVSDVAHELRTPLAAMLAASEGMTSDDAQRRARAERLLVGQTRRLARMVDDLLEISRFDAGQAELSLEEADLEQLVTDAVHLVAPDRPVTVTAVGNVLAEVDAPRVHAIVRNLVGNAVQHGSPPIEVLVDGREDELLVTVADAGPGVPPDLAPVIFDRFVRGDAARGTGDRQWTTGLGLAIAQENAALHGGSITLGPGERTEFVLRLPRRIETARTSLAPAALSG